MLRTCRPIYNHYNDKQGIFMNKPAITIVTAALIGTCSPLWADTTAQLCDQVGKAEAICGFPAPEDIDLMPDGETLVLSAFGGLNGEHPQKLRLFNTQTLAVQPLPRMDGDTPMRWDGDACPDAPDEAFGSHGIDISQRADGAWQLLAVNHVRESVEMFEIVNLDTEPALAWRGCVVVPENSSINDTAALPDGGLLATQMMEKTEGDMMEAMAQQGVTGHVWRWRPGKGLDILPGSEANLANGVAVSPDGKTVFVAETGIGQVRKIDYETGNTLGTAKATSADNFSWAPDGRLIVTGINGPMTADCMTAPGPCLAPFQVQAIDPDTMETTVIWQQNGAPMGAGTVGVIVGDFLYAGSFKGNQLMRVRLSP